MVDSGRLASRMLPCSRAIQSHKGSGAVHQAPPPLSVTVQHLRFHTRTDFQSRLLEASPASRKSSSSSWLGLVQSLFTEFVSDRAGPCTSFHTGDGCARALRVFGTAYHTLLSTQFQAAALPPHGQRFMATQERVRVVAVRRSPPAPTAYLDLPDWEIRGAASILSPRPGGLEWAVSSLSSPRWSTSHSDPFPVGRAGVACSLLCRFWR